MRECGECQACCFLPEIPERGSPGYSRCPDQCAAGCARYEERPQRCRDFACGWLQGFGGIGDRPDKVGFIIMTPDEGEQHPDKLRAWEPVEGGADEAALARLPVDVMVVAHRHKRRLHHTLALPMAVTSKKRRAW